MSKLAYDNFRAWGVDEVSTWLGELHLSNHIPSFERNGITGARLADISDKEIRDQLKVVKPSELMALKGAITSLVGRGASRKISGQNSKSMKNTRDRTGSFERRVVSPGAGTEHRTKTLPHISLASARNVTEKPEMRTPMLKIGSAPELLDDQCRYSGWIRKQGGGHKNWKRRYLILRAGCLYYFSNETASSPKGKFGLSGYQTSICREPDILKKYPFVLKLEPMNPHVRTYYVSFGSKGELERWKNELDKEIERYNQSLTQVRVPSLGSPTIPSMYEEEEEDFEEPPVDGDRIYDKVDGDDDEPEYERADSNIYDDPAEIDNSDGEGHYSRVEQLSPDSKPIVPLRSRVSLQPEPNSVHIQAPAAVLPSTIVESDIVENENPYLPIIDGKAAVQAVMQDTVSPSHEPPQPVMTNSTKPEDEDYVDPGSDEEEGSDSDDDDGGYYIMFRKPDELMPASCLFDRLDRADADKLLRRNGFDGTYLIREGSHAGAEKVLSVWHIDRCRHYKLFKDDESFFSLTQGQRFRNMPELLQYYSLQSHLPRSDFYLGNPYHPDDH